MHGDAKQLVSGFVLTTGRVNWERLTERGEFKPTLLISKPWRRAVIENIRLM